VSERVASAEVFVLTRPIAPRVGVSVAWAARHEYVLVRLTDHDGRSGWGETYLMPGLAEVVRDLAGLVVGQPAAATRRHRAAFVATLSSTYAASALLIALDDLRGRQAGVPVFQLYGGTARAVPAYAASPGYVEAHDPEETWPAELASYADEGFDAVKLRVGRYPVAREAPILETVRASAGSVRLMADGNGGYRMADAVRMGGVLAELGFDWFEEPLPQRGGYPRYPDLAAKLRVTLAGGEIVETPAEARRLLAAGGVDVIQPEPVICGGIPGLLEIADLAALHGVPVVPHTSGGALGLVAALHAIACLPEHDLLRLELGRGANELRSGLLAKGPNLDRGTVEVPLGAGLGVEVDEDLVRRTAEATFVGSAP
jgi:D-galactarolactone cycloisomerase